TRIEVLALDGAAASAAAAAGAFAVPAQSPVVAEPDFVAPAKDVEFKVSEPMFAPKEVRLDADDSTEEIAEPSPAPARRAPQPDVDELYGAVAQALKREGDDPDADHAGRERLFKACRAAMDRTPQMLPVWVSLLHDKNQSAHDVVEQITGELSTDISDLGAESRGVVEYVLQQFQRETGVDLRGDALAVQRIADAAEEAVPRLHRRGWDEINLPFITAAGSGPLHLNVRVIPSAVGLTRQHQVQPGQQRAHFQVLPGGKQVKAGGCGPVVIALVIVGFVVTLAVVIAAFASMADPEPWPDTDWAELPQPNVKDAPLARNSPAPANNKARSEPPQTKRLSAERIRELEAALKSLADNVKDENAAESLASLEAIEAECEGVSQHGLRWPLERARTNVELAIMRIMQERYGRDNRGIYELTEQHHYAEAARRLADLETYLNQTATHKNLADRMAMDEYVRDQPDRIRKASAEYLATTLLATDQQLALCDYTRAAASLAALADNAVLDDASVKLFRTEADHWRAQADKQWKGELPAPTKPFDTRKDRLPPAPISTMLPKGEATAIEARRALDKRLEQRAKAKSLQGTEVPYLGGKVQFDVPDDWRLRMLVTRPCAPGDATFQYELRLGLHQLPAQVRLRLYGELAPSRDELLAMVLYAFENGLLDDAQRLACELWKRDESVKADLDGLLATKLKIAVPEGGFIEREGKLVAPD
ncbi:MAG: Hsp70 family protein, partial [Planctomycetes bacterium]|nr:Hsp70 family protein [Planctomycetota bacterium]